MQTDSIEQLQGRKATIDRLLKLSSTGGDAERLKKESLDLAARIDEIPRQKNTAAAKAFDERFENFQKNQEKNREYEIEAAKKLEADRKKREEELEKINSKIKDIEKKSLDVFDSLDAKSNAGNPFVSLFSEADKSIGDLRESLKYLSPELQAVALQLQQKINADSLFNARLTNDFARFDLTERAYELRQFKKPKIEDTDKFYKDFIEDAIKQAVAANGGSRTRYNSNIFTDKTGKKFTTGFTQTDLRDELSTVFERTGGFQESSSGKGFGNNTGGFFRRPKTFADLNEKEKNDFINKDNLPFQQRLQRAFDLAENRKTLNDDQASTIDRKIIALSSGVRPEQLTERQRDLVATANEKEAARKSSMEKSAAEDRKKLLEYQKATTGFLKKLEKFATDKGFSVAFGEKPLLDVNVTVDGKTVNDAKTGAGRPSPDDTATAMNLPSVSSGGGLTNR